MWLRGSELECVEMMSAGLDTNYVRILSDFKWVLDYMDINPKGANSVFDNVSQLRFRFRLSRHLGRGTDLEVAIVRSWQAGAFASSPVRSGGHLLQLQ